MCGIRTNRQMEWIWASEWPTHLPSLTHHEHSSTHKRPPPYPVHSKLGMTGDLDCPLRTTNIHPCWRNCWDAASAGAPAAGDAAAAAVDATPVPSAIVTDPSPALPLVLPPLSIATRCNALCSDQLALKQSCELGTGERGSRRERGRMSEEVERRGGRGGAGG